MSHRSSIATRTVAGLAVAGLLGLGGTAFAASGEGSASPAKLPECTNAQLHAHYRGTDAGMSHQYGEIVLKNVSDTTCLTEGFGGLSYVGHGDGTQVGAAATRAPGTRVHPIVVKPGQHVISQMSAADAEVYPRHTCRPEHVNGFRVYLPDETRSQFVRHATTGCANPKVDLLTHQAFS